MSNLDPERWKTPPELAEEFGKTPEYFIAKIKSGELRAVNLGDGKQRPRYRISPEALEDFLRSREVNPPATPAPRPRRRASRWY